MAETTAQASAAWGAGQCWRLARGRWLALDAPRVLGILNVTPDSFSDGGQHMDAGAALAAAERMVGEGAAMLDIGGESTRPGASRVSAAEQIRRVIPVIEAIRRAGGALGEVPLSIDTTHSSVAEAALGAGADTINDVSAGTEDARVLDVAAQRSAGLILMHRLRPPDTDSYSDRYAQPPRYTDVAAEVGSFLRARAEAAMAAGVMRDAIVLDPGLGFGKTVEQNLELIRRSGDFAGLGFPLLSAASRKSFVGCAIGLEKSEPRERTAGSIAVSIMHYERGVRLFRVHDVAAQVQALRTAAAVLGR
jgi:dihydropteroate synthase